MALKLLLNNGKGLEYSYHRILVYAINFKDNVIGINLAQYRDENYREIEKETGDDMILNNIGIELPIIDNDFSRERLYERIKKEVEMFANSEDI